MPAILITDYLKALNAATREFSNAIEDRVMPRKTCEERLRLSDGVAMAVQVLFAAEAVRGRAVKAKKELSAYDAVLAEARKAERFSISALDQHRKEHGC